VVREGLPIGRPPKPGCMEKAEVLGVVRDQGPPRASGQREMRFIPGPLHRQVPSGASSVASVAKTIRQLTGNVMVEVEVRHLGGIERDLRVNQLLVAPIVGQRCLDSLSWYAIRISEPRCVALHGR